MELKLKQMEGRCPNCNSDNIDYGELVSDTNTIIPAQYYPIACANCGFKGKAWYKLDFQEFTDNENNSLITISDLVNVFPQLYHYDFKEEKDLNEVLSLLGYELIEGYVNAGDYHDIESYMDCRVKKIGGYP